MDDKVYVKNSFGVDVFLDMSKEFSIEKITLHQKDTLHELRGHFIYDFKGVTGIVYGNTNPTRFLIYDEQYEVFLKALDHYYYNKKLESILNE